MVAAHWPFWLLLIGSTCMIDAFSPVSTRPTCTLRSARISCKSSSNSAVQHGVVEPQQQRSFSDAAEWHRERRRLMLQKYGSQIASLERSASSQRLALPLLIASNLSLLALSVYSGCCLSTPLVLLLAAFPGSVLSLWQLQILHDVLHGSMFDKGRSKHWGIPKRNLQDAVLFWGSMPSAFGYYLYLRYGHLSHHKNVGDPTRANLRQLFESNQADFEDGDVLFVAHRMKLSGDNLPRFQWFGKELKLSISKSGFNSWKEGNAAWNACVFASSFLLERFMLVANDVTVAVTGRNYFFPNKPTSFHKACARYARCATLLRGALWATCGWKSLLFLLLSETLWSLPPHPASAMFVTNHGSSPGDDGSCIPTSSTYVGRWYSILTLGTNYHCEHHDFPTIPLTHLGQLRKIAPEFYRTGSKDCLWTVMKKTFAHPDFYACMDVGIL